MKNATLFSFLLFFFNMILCMQESIDRNLNEMYENKFIEAAQEDWNYTTKKIIKEGLSSTPTAQIFNRYTTLYLQRARDLHRPNKPVMQTIKELSVVFPNKNELNIILGNTATTGAWIKSLFISEDLKKSCAEEWKKQLTKLENALKEENQKK